MSVVEDPTEAGSTSGGGGGNIASSSILMILGFSGHLWLLALFFLVGLKMSKVK